MAIRSSETGNQAKQSSPISKISTGVVGLDNVLNGGLPDGRITLFSGGPGTGKTILGLEFIVRGAQTGNPGIVLTFEERASDLRKYAQCLGWDLESLEAQETLGLISARIQPDAVIAGDFDLRGILSILRQKVQALKAQRVLIDAPDVFLRLLDNMAKERAELGTLNNWLRDAGLTAVMTAKAGSSGAFSSHYDFLDYMADCVVHLDQRE
jgi:circadian clock protein KaiC